MITALLKQNADWPTRWIMRLAPGAYFHDACLVHFFAEDENEALIYAGGNLAARYAKDVDITIEIEATP